MPDLTPRNVADVLAEFRIYAIVDQEGDRLGTGIHVRRTRMHDGVTVYVNMLDLNDTIDTLIRVNLALRLRDLTVYENPLSPQIIYVTH